MQPTLHVTLWRIHWALHLECILHAQSRPQPREDAGVPRNGQQGFPLAGPGVCSCRSSE